MNNTVKLSRKNQIVIPKACRTQSGIKAGDTLLVEAANGIVLLLPKKNKWSGLLSGISGGIYTTKYLKKERDAW